MQLAFTLAFGLGLGSHDKEWAWALEIAGSTLIGMGAIHYSLSLRA
jgi:hypothetical protein